MRNNFVRCGVLGWCWEILVTGLHNFLSAERLPLMGNTSILMFPIYGCGALLRPLAHSLQKKSFLLRGFCYTIFIFIGEYVSGSFLKKRNICPWDYSRARWNIGGVIRLDYAPGWFLLGLIMERILITKNK